jgi:hypothetical protein
MWHQIADNLVAYAKSTEFDKNENTNLLDLYSEMVKPLWNRLNPIKYALISVYSSRQIADVEAAIEFLEEARKRLDKRNDA